MVIHVLWLVFKGLLVYACGATFLFHLGDYVFRLDTEKDAKQDLSDEDFNMLMWGSLIWFIVLPFVVWIPIWSTLFDKLIMRRRRLRKEVAQLEKERELAEKELEDQLVGTH